MNEPYPTVQTDPLPDVDVLVIGGESLRISSDEPSPSICPWSCFALNDKHSSAHLTNTTQVA